GLTITKSFGDSDLTDAQKGNIVFKVTGNGLKKDGTAVSELTKKYSDFTGDPKKWVLTQADGIMDGVTYTVSETADSVEITGYNRTTTVKVNSDEANEQLSDSITIAEGTGTVAFVNTYIHKTGDLTVTKSVESAATADHDLMFGFTVTLSDETINGTYGDMSFTDGVATFELKDGESKTATGLPTGITYTVEEDECDDFTTLATGADGTIVEDGREADFENTRKLGELEIGKIVSSDLEDDDELEFTFIVTLDGAPITGLHGDMNFEDGVAIVVLKSGEKALADELPTGVKYTVEEDECEGFISEANGDTGTIADNRCTAEFTNTRKIGKAIPEINKKIDGKDAKAVPDGEYVFKLTPVGGAPMPEKDTVTIVMKDGTTEGTAQFGEITYCTVTSEPYVYEITEVPGDTPNMTYSTEKVVMTVEVTEGEKELVTKITYTDNNNTLINTYEIPRVSVMVKKVWKDDGNRDGLRPTGLKIELLADGEATGQYANLNAENNWLDRIEDLPKCKDDKDITYTWKEPSVVGYTLTGTATSGELTTLTNTHVPEKTKVQVKKVWVDSGKHPSDIKVQLFADGKATDKVATLNAANNWTYSWDDLCKNANNEGLSREIRYTVAETEIPEGYVAKITGDASTGFVITNTLETGKLVIQKEFDIKEQEDKPDEDEMTTEIEVVKIWDDNDNKDGNRPESITVHLFAGGEEVRTAKLSADNGWKRKFGDLPKFVKGRPIQYTVTEDPVDMYVTEIYGFTIRNRYQPNLTSATIRKVWNDEENKLQNRPLSIVMTLKNGSTVIQNVVLNEQNGWTATITGLPAKLNGEPAAYTWTEQAVLGYVQESITTNGTVTVITNKLWTRPDTPTQGRTPKFPGETVDIEEYDTPLGIEVVINHVGDCFD
ncbi:Cna B-type domain-containing protein, partial [Aristaeella lactis]